MNAMIDVQEDEEISLFDVFDFFRRNRLVIIGSAVLGVLLAALYLFITPPRYEATLQIEMARFQSVSDGNSATQNGTPVEPAALLVERLRLPSSYTLEAAQVCGLQDSRFPFNALAKKVSAKALKNIDAVVEITVEGGAVAAGRACATGVFDMVRHQHNELLSPRITEASKTLSELKQRLEANQSFLTAMDKTSVQSAVYLSKRDESLWLMDRISAFERALRQTSETRLVSPIYSSPHAVSPKPMVTLFVGAVVGVCFGIGFAYLRKLAARWRLNDR